MPWQPCCVCGEETSNYCRPCAQTHKNGTLIKARFHCDIDCRKKDEAEHLKVHMNIPHVMPHHFERAIKAGGIAQSLFYALLENTWTYDMRHVCIKRDQDHDLIAVEVTDGDGVKTAPGGRTDCKSHAGGWLIEFPNQSFSAFDDDAKHALLTDHNSIWAFVTMHTAVQGLFQDLVDDIQTDIKEVVHYPTDKASRIVHTQGTFGFESRRHDQLYPDVDERGDIKGVYDITLKDGSRIALDLAGAQWNLQDGKGVHSPVTYWADYWSCWGDGIKYRIPFRSHALKHAAKMSKYRMITPQTLIAEMMIYFNVLMQTECKIELGFYPRELLEMNTQTYRDAEQRFLSKAAKYIQKRPGEIDNGQPLNVLGEFDLRHPKVIADAPKPHHKSNDSLPLDTGDMAKFDWKALSRFIQQPASEVSLKEKKRAKALQKKRSVYKEPGNWKLIFLDDTLPATKVPAECVSENRMWKLN